MSNSIDIIIIIVIILSKAGANMNKIHEKNEDV